MKITFAIFTILLAVMVLSARAVAAELTRLPSLHRHIVWRAWAQDCFLMPDVAVAVDALGPYCSSPRGSWRYRHVIGHW